MPLVLHNQFHPQQPFCINQGVDSVACPNLQNNLMSLKNIMLYFMIKFVIDDQVGSRIINVLIIFY